MANTTTSGFNFLSMLKILLEMIINVIDINRVAAKYRPISSDFSLLYGFASKIIRHLKLPVPVFFRFESTFKQSLKTYLFAQH